MVWCACNSGSAGCVVLRLGVFVVCVTVACVVACDVLLFGLCLWVVYCICYRLVRLLLVCVGCGLLWLARHFWLGLVVAVGLLCL